MGGSFKQQADTFILESSKQMEDLVVFVLALVEVLGSWVCLQVFDEDEVVVVENDNVAAVFSSCCVSNCLNVRLDVLCDSSK